ncbi:MULTISPECIES: Gfo/Idh/MocA family protein [Sphingomonas]|uniref:Gfo/Idh/MocA family protein n=1 Tax=Sphingomonas TaxID=13687 RepID=UPI0006FAD609|nr:MULTISPECIES: Gfo/Idh/MocA family oxidoreductase [Sphingomonas]KQM92109.1 oxidoreductase [Sphingomonas sp. Leaf226]MDY0967277.1 Gfo/Idh/MocA family oxidoreductase [Sphingomonas sp. CFBP9021]
MRYGVVGTGMMGVEHIRNLAILPGAEIVAIADPVATSIDWATEALGDQADGVARFDSVESFAKRADVDAIIIASPNNTHRDVLERLFAMDAAILCEKPLATTIDDARWIVERAAAHARPFWTGMEYRFMPPAAAFIEQVQAGRVGRLQMLAIREHRFPFLPKVGDWNRFARNTGGTMVEKCCHFFDLMRLIVGSEAVRVHCSGAMDVNHLDELYDGERPDIIDNSYTTVDFANGVRAMLDLSMFADGAENQEEMSATGDAARLDVLIPAGELVYSPRVGFLNPKAVERSHVSVDPAARAAGSHEGATYYQHAAFAAAVRGEGPVQVTAEDGLRAVAIGTAAEISAREHRVVTMAELGL